MSLPYCCFLPQEGSWLPLIIFLATGCSYLRPNWPLGNACLGPVPTMILPPLSTISFLNVLGENWKWLLANPKPNQAKLWGQAPLQWLSFMLSRQLCWCSQSHSSWLGWRFHWRRMWTRLFIQKQEILCKRQVSTFWKIVKLKAFLGSWWVFLFFFQPFSLSVILWLAVLVCQSFTVSICLLIFVCQSLSASLCLCLSVSLCLCLSVFLPDWFNLD